MPKPNFHAHSLDQKSETEWQTLADHLNGVGVLAAGFASVFGSAGQARAVGLLHDLGKYTEAFQRRLRGGPRVDHATWGAKVALERYRIGYWLAYVIAGHHAGLANGRAGEARTGLADRLAASLPPLDARWEEEIELPRQELLLEEVKTLARGVAGREMFQLALRIRMLFSCLVDADYLDTEAFYLKAEGARLLRQEPMPTLIELRAALDAHLALVQQKVTSSEINCQRAHILSHVRAGAAQPPGVFSLTVPTGGGKTLASLAFALDHAIAHGLQRVIVVIPFTSIVEQTAAVFRHAFGERGKAAVLEHHSAFIDKPDEAPEAREKLALAMENWDAPVVVTTAVQFFESLFADRPSRCRKLHNIAGSVVVLDEAQTMPLPLLTPSVAMLDELARNYRCSIVLCTATQPVLAAPKFTGGFEQVHELAPEPQRLYQALRRVTVRHAGELDDELLQQRLRQHEQVLLIVNNRRHARALFEAIQDEPGAYHLSTFMCAAHRRKILATVWERLALSQPCRLISTSLIEAGVDVDFPYVLRAEAGLDSIAQAAGRCNREGRRSPERSVVEIFTAPQWRPPLVLRSFADVTREVLRHPECQADPLSLMTIERYFSLLYWQKGDGALDQHGLMALLARSKLDSLPFETLAKQYRLIEDAQWPVIIPYRDEQGGHDAELLLQELEHAEYCGALARRLQVYTVSLPRYAYDALLKAGAIQPVAPRFGEQFMRLANPSLYHEGFGLHWDEPGFIKAEDALW